MVRIFLLTVTFTTIPFVTCVVLFPVRVSSLKSLLFHTMVVNNPTFTLRGIFTSSAALQIEASAESCLYTVEDETRCPASNLTHRHTKS